MRLWKGFKEIDFFQTPSNHLNGFPLLRGAVANTDVEHVGFSEFSKIHMVCIKILPT